MHGKEGQVPATVYSLEFRRRTRVLREMGASLTDRKWLSYRIRNDPVIPPNARDLAVRALEEEISKGKTVCMEFIRNYIALSRQGLIPVDIECEWSINPKCRPVMERCVILAADEIIPLFEENAVDLAEVLLKEDEADPVGRIHALYKEEETRFDRSLDGSLSRCSLNIVQERFPGNTLTITIRLPADVILKEERTKNERRNVGV